MKLKHTLSMLIPSAVFFLLVSCNGTTEDTCKIEKGTFSQTIIETGELAAVDTRTFVLPRYGDYWYEMKIIGLLDHGSEVKAGDSIIQLDPTEIKKFIIELESQKETEEANLQKLLVNQSNRRNEIDTNLKNAQASFNLKKLAMEFNRFESDQIRKINELGFEQEKIRLAKVKRSIEFNRIIESNDLIIQKIRIKQIKRQLQGAYDVLPKLTIRTPISGIFQIGRNRRSRVLLKLGDEIYQGANMGNVPNLTWMKVNTIVNEYDYLKLQKGQKVIVRLDAMPNVSYKGEISVIEKLCYLKNTKSRQKVFDVQVRLLNSDVRLKPGMTVSCEYYCNEIKNATFVPISCIDSTEAGNFIYLKKGNSYLPTKVITGPANNTHIIIKGDFKKGQLLIPVDAVKNPENN
jgi:HlyD family secretion protein